MKNVRSFTLCILLVVLAILFSACKGEPEPQGPQQSEFSSDSGSAPTGPAELVLVADGKTEYRIITPGGASDEVNNAATALFYAFEDAGVTIEMIPDWAQDGDDPTKRATKEILIGDTNREESEELGKGLLNDDYVIATKGERVIIRGGGDGATALACSLFVSEYIKDIKNGVVIPTGTLKENKATYPITSLKLGAQSVEECCIVYTTSAYRAAAETLRDEIAKNAGFVLPVVSASNATEHSIFVGAPKTADDVAPCTAAKFLASDKDSLKHYIEQKDGALLLAGYSDWMVEDAVANFVSRYIDGKSGDVVVPELDEEHDILASVPVTDSADVRIMTFNTHGDIGENPQARYPLIYETVRKYLPDVVGFQEANKPIHNNVLESLTSVYAHVSKYHSYGSVLTYTPIMYRKDTLDLIDSGAEFLRSRYTGTNSKAYSWAVFEFKATGKRFIVINLHGAIISAAYNLEGMTNAVEGAEWRRDNVAQIHEKATQLKEKHGALPVFLIGDFNFNSSSAAYSDATALGYVTAEKTATKHKETGSKTTHGIGSIPPAGKSIDHIFYQGATTAIAHYIVRDKVALSASDHCPVYCDAKLN